MGGAAAQPSQLDDTVRRVVAASLDAQVARIEWLEGQLGLRRFARVHLETGPPASLIARVEAPEDPSGRPPGLPPEPPLEPVRALLEREGLPVPVRHGGDAAAGVELLEDVGSTTLAAAADASNSAERRALYHEACDLVPRLQRVRDPGGGVAAFDRRLDDAHFAYKADLFATWSLAARGRPASNAEAKAVREAFRAVAREVGRAPLRLAHRDFQSANLHLRGNRAPGERLVMIDLQGALLAPPEYDLVCLLRDSYVELEAAELAHQLERIRPRLPDAPDPDTFAWRFDLLTLTRKGKDHARFLYAAQERGDRRFLRHLPATLRALREASARLAERAADFSAIAALVAELPETPCAE
jgi:aminoglycoside/choline kinase family phosphotransferase